MQVKGAGTRIAKTDVGWIGNGDSQYSFDSVQVKIDLVCSCNAWRRLIGQQISIKFCRLIDLTFIVLVVFSHSVELSVPCCR